MISSVLREMTNAVERALLQGLWFKLTVQSSSQRLRSDIHPTDLFFFLWNLLLRSSIAYGDLAVRRFHCWMFPSAASESGYLEVSVDNVKGVQISHRLQHLANHVAGVTLRVVTLVQDPVEHLPACGSAQKQKPTAVEEPGCAPS